MKKLLFLVFFNSVLSVMAQSEVFDFVSIGRGITKESAAQKAMDMTSQLLVEGFGVNFGSDTDSSFWDSFYKELKSPSQGVFVKNEICAEAKYPIETFSGRTVYCTTIKSKINLKKFVTFVQSKGGQTSFSVTKINAKLKIYQAKEYFQSYWLVWLGDDLFFWNLHFLNPGLSHAYGDADHSELARDSTMKFTVTFNPSKSATEFGIFFYKTLLALGIDNVREAQQLGYDLHEVFLSIFSNYQGQQGNKRIVLDYTWTESFYENSTNWQNTWEEGSRCDFSKGKGQCAYFLKDAQVGELVSNLKKSLTEALFNFWGCVDSNHCYWWTEMKNFSRIPTREVNYSAYTGQGADRHRNVNVIRYYPSQLLHYCDKIDEYNDTRFLIALPFESQTSFFHSQEMTIKIDDFDSFEGMKIQRRNISPFEGGFWFWDQFQSGEINEDQYINCCLNFMESITNAKFYSRFLD